MATLTLVQEQGYAQPGLWPGSEGSVGAEGKSRSQGIAGSKLREPCMLGPHHSQSIPFAIVFLIKEYKYSSSKYSGFFQHSELTLSDTECLQSS